MSRASDENGQTADLAALREWLDQADGLTVTFPAPLLPHQLALMESLGVVAKVDDEKK